MLCLGRLAVLPNEFLSGPTFGISHGPGAPAAPRLPSGPVSKAFYPTPTWSHVSIQQVFFFFLSAYPCARH